MENTLNQEVFMSDIKLFSPDIWNLIIRYSFNLVIIFILVRLIYYRFWKNSNYAFTYFMFNTVIFFVCYMLSSVRLSIGFAFGLFAVFAILRYRTKPIPIREMTYLFIVITVGVINSLTTSDISYVEILFTNLTIIVLAFVLESYWQKYFLLESVVIYEKIENIKPEYHERLLSDLRERTGLDIKRFEIVRTDFLRDVARLKVYHTGKKNGE